MITAMFMCLLVLGGLSALCYAGLWLGPGAGTPAAVPSFLAVMAGAFLLYAVACWVAPRVQGRRVLVAIAAGAVVFRLIAAAGPVLYDNDIYRYHWDGRVLAAGHNPYLYAPGDHRLAGLRDAYWGRVAFKQVRTIYPPLDEALSAATYLFWPRPGRIRALAALFDLATAGAVLLLLRALGLPAALVIIYAWNPLPIKEFANSGHLDSVSIFFATLALWLLVSGRARASGWLLGLGLLAKGWVAALVPLYLRRGRARALLPCAATVAAGVLPFALAGRGLASGTAAYARGWEFNSGFFALVRLGFERLGLGRPGGAGVDLSAGLAARMVVVALFALLALAVARRSGEGAEAVRAAGLLVMAVLLLSPVCDPWYVCWLLPMLCVHHSRAGLGFTALVCLSYLYYLDPRLDPAARAVEYGALAVLLAWEAASRHPARLWASRAGRPTGSENTTPRGAAPHPAGAASP